MFRLAKVTSCKQVIQIVFYNGCRIYEGFFSISSAFIYDLENNFQEM